MKNYPAFVVRLVLFVTKLSELICPGLNFGSSGNMHIMSSRISGIDTVIDMGVQVLDIEVVSEYLILVAEVE